MPVPTKRHHTEETMRKALTAVSRATFADSPKGGGDDPLTVLTEAVDEVIERRAWIEGFKDTIVRWNNVFRAR